jgi:hypothetical protein
LPLFQAGMLESCAYLTTNTDQFYVIGFGNLSN